MVTIIMAIVSKILLTAAIVFLIALIVTYVATREKTARFFNV